MLIVRWKIYCQDESAHVEGFLDESDGIPVTCFNNISHTISNPVAIEKIIDNYTCELSYWKIFCDTEQEWSYGYSTIENPEFCFHNNTHTTSNTSIRLKRIRNNFQKIKEETVETGGYFQTVSYKLVCPVGESVHDYTYPHPISACGIKFNSTPDHIDDVLHLEVAPNTVIGTITHPIENPTSTLQVSSTVIENIKVGFYVNITDGVNTDSLGKVTNVNPIASTITTQHQTTSSFLSGTYVRIIIRTMDNYTIGFPGHQSIGDTKIGGSYIPANTVIRVRYINNGDTIKNFYASIEMLY
jgi:hypothetical protein